MALSGMALLAYIVAHLLGNLKVYLGPAEINAYGEALRDLGDHIVPRTHLLWIMRFGLTAAFAIHVHAAFSLTLENRRKGGEVRYQTQREYLVANYASRTMIWSGIIVLLFLAYHLADLTWGVTNPDFIRGDIYHNMVASFSRVPVAALYIVANVALGFHIFHGAWSMFQSIGANNPRFNHWRLWLARGLATAVVFGNVLFPIMVLVGVVE
jgi:succinate dehydrogenase / fumarate reductase cytochrome b subunit